VCLNFKKKVWVGRACARANEEELTRCAQKGGLEFKKKRSRCKKEEEKPQSFLDWRE
jgi:hypothetical protein